MKPFAFCSRRFGYVLLAGGVLALQDIAFNIDVTTARRRVFSDEWMEENVGPMHKMYVAKDSPTPKLGYPDMGNGFYAKKLSYKNWYEFNNV